MSGYTFNHFMRDLRDGGLSTPTRMALWLHGASIAELAPIRNAVGESRRVTDAIGAAMTPAERDNPRTLIESRRLEIAAVAHVTDRVLFDVLQAFEQFARLAPMRRRLWWQELLIHSIRFIGLPALLVGSMVWLVLFIMNRLL